MPGANWTGSNSTGSNWRAGAARRRFAVGAAALGALAVLIGAWATLAGDAMREPVAAADFELAAGGYEILDELDLERPLLGVAIRPSGGGHFFLKARVNGWPLDFMVDTGASYVTLNYRDARQAGISLPDSAFKHQVRTANGVARVAAVRVSRIEYRTLRVDDVVALVSQRGAMDGMNLLGNSFLSKLRTFKVHNGQLIMR